MCALLNIKARSDLGGLESPQMVIPFNLAASLRTTSFNIQKFYTVLALIWVFCTDLRTYSDFCFVRH